MFYQGLTCLLVALPLVSSQIDPESNPYEWLPEQFPNPRRNPQGCGLGNARGYVCDPNGLLSKKELLVLNWLMEGLAHNDTRCPCSIWACEQKEHGYPVGIAIMKKMKIPDRSRSVLDQAQVFANNLQTSRWNFGRCDEGIIVLYSQDDEVLQFMAGNTARRVLTNEVARSLAYKVGQHFRPGGHLARGFYNLGLLLRDVLNGNTMYALAPQAEALHGSATSIPVFMSTILMSLLTLYIVS